MYNYIKRERGLIMCFILLREKKKPVEIGLAPLLRWRGPMFWPIMKQNGTSLFENFFIQEKQMEKK